MSSCSNSECTCAEVIDSAERRQSLRGRPNLIEGIKDLLGSRTHGDVLGEVDPANDTVGVDQKLGRSRNVRAFRPRPAMQHVVTANDLRLGVRQQRELVTTLL